jgi:hypothetical protein
VICNLDVQKFSRCFVEIDEAVRAMTDRAVCFNAHRGIAPPGSIVFQTENVPLQVADPRALWPDHEIWDLSASNAAKYGATHVPIGYHPSMERFKRAASPDIDVVFSGAINQRRADILNELQARGLRVVVVPVNLYGRGRDALLARAKLALNMQFYPDGIFPALRVAHLVANHVPVLSEYTEEGWGFIPTCAIGEMVDRAERMVRDPADAKDNAAFSYLRFKEMPMVLPS